jgi:non-canonical purine NTP pyrophosphatase (RdgB/HAM1 family)
LSKVLVVASRNRKKAEELKRLLDFLPLEIHSLADYEDGKPTEETGETFLENARIKALAASKLTGQVSIADDSGLMVEALGGLPGVRSARFAGEGADDQGNNRLLLEKLNGLDLDKRDAKFVCSIVIASPDEVLFQTQAECPGKIALEASEGKYGFGYDPLFIPNGYVKTFANLPPEIKDAISHRGKALKQACQFLKEWCQTF